MPKLRPRSKRDVLHILRNNGFKEVGGTRHIKLKKIIDDGIIFDNICFTWVKRDSSKNYKIHNKTNGKGQERICVSYRR